MFKKVIFFLSFFMLSISSMQAQTQDIDKEMDMAIDKLFETLDTFSFEKLFDMSIFDKMQEVKPDADQLKDAEDQVKDALRMMQDIDFSMFDDIFKEFEEKVKELDGSLLNPPTKEGEEKEVRPGRKKI